MMRRRIFAILAGLMLTTGLTFSAAAFFQPTPAAAVERKDCLKNPDVAITPDDCAKGETTSPTDEVPSGSDSKKSAGKSDRRAEDLKTPFVDETPVDAPGQWAKSAAKTAQDWAVWLADLLEKGSLLSSTGLGRDQISLYAIMWALGWLLAFAATAVGLAKAGYQGATGGARELLGYVASRLLLFGPITATLPMALGLIGEVAGGVASGFADLGKDRVIDSLWWLAGAIGGLTGIASAVPGGAVAVLILMLILAGCLLVVIIELLIAKYVVFVLALLLPVMFAAAINPSWRGGVKKVSGVLLGAYLAPAALFFVWAATWSLVAGPDAAGMGFIERVLLFIVGLLVALAAPMAIGMIVSHVVPAFTGETGDYSVTRSAALKTAGSGRQAASGAQSAARAVRASRANNASSIHKSYLAAGSPGAFGGAGAPATAGAAGAGSGVAAGGGPHVAAAAAAVKAGNNARREGHAAINAVGSRVDTYSSDGQGSIPDKTSGPSGTGSSEARRSGRHQSASPGPAVEADPRRAAADTSVGAEPSPGERPPPATDSPMTAPRPNGATAAPTAVPRSNPRQLPAPSSAPRAAGGGSAPTGPGAPPPRSTRPQGRGES